MGGFLVVEVEVEEERAIIRWSYLDSLLMF